MEEMALHFNNNAQIYDTVRPGYPNEIYEIISNYKHFNTDSNILEIGAGSGIASQEIYNKWQSNLVLIEPGNNLCELLDNKFKNNGNIKIENTTFEKYQNKILFDAIFSATAFHWIDVSMKYKKSYEVLHNDGLLILYWNNYGIEINSMENEIQKIYFKNRNGISDGKSVYERQMEKIESRKMEVEESEYFKIIEHKIIKNTREYTADNYIKLLKTFSDHSKMDKEFFNEIKKVINKNGNRIIIRIIINLEIAEKL
jgi:SAM-dependent methyltransferase